MTTPAERAKRAYDHLRLLHSIHGDGCAGRWIAISLADGRCDNRLYDSKAEAIRFQLHETQCAYFCFAGVPLLKEIQYFLDANETLYDAGFSLSDPATYLNPEALL
ncbi:hypothetical protein ABZ208_37575 [Streptomyces sp. NPDC006208]|uniref:hypothetical protein n=1 Tax=Streptomyces sp. NPDC006208 TaxID=3156734 RepID=UPI0033B9638E